MNRAGRPQSGFTLLELLLALTLIGFMLAMAYGGLSAVLRAADSGEAQIDRNNKVRITQGFLRQQWSRIVPLAYKQDRATGVPTVFEGSAERIKYVAPMPGYLGYGGAYVQELELVPGPRGTRDLVLRFWLLNGYDDGKVRREDGDEVLLLEGIRSARFSFRKIDLQGKVGPYQSDWTEPASTPVMIRLELEPTIESRLVWPTLEVAMVIDANTARSFFSNAPFGSG